MSKRIRRLDQSCGSGRSPPSSRCVRRPSPSRHEEEWRDWANLPRELVEDIAGHLLRYDVAEYIRLRTACTEWRKCTADPRERALDRRFRPRRWILLSNRTDGDGRRFLNLVTGSGVRVDLPELSRHHLEASAEGLLLLRDKATHAVRLLNPLTRVLTYLPPITGGARIVWTEPFESATRIVYAGISDETTPASVVLVMTDHAVRSCSVAYAAKPGDGRWALIDDWARRSWHSLVFAQGRRMPRGHWYSSVATLQRRVYLCTPEGNILKVALRPKPRLVPVVANQPMNQCNNVVSYLVPPPDDEDDDGGMLMVRYYRNLGHLGADEERKMKRRRDVIKVPTRWLPRRYDWQLIQVFELDDLAAGGTRLVPVEDVGRDRAVFVGEVACFSVSARTFPCLAGNAVYPGAAGVCCPPVGVRYLADKSMDPPFQFTTDNETLPRALIEGSPLKGRPEVNLVPVARPCTLQEYLSCCSGLKGGLKH